MITVTLQSLKLCLDYIYNIDRLIKEYAHDKAICLVESFDIENLEKEVIYSFNIFMVYLNAIYMYCFGKPMYQKVYISDISFDDGKIYNVKNVHGKQKLLSNADERKVVNYNSKVIGSFNDIDVSKMLNVYFESEIFLTVNAFLKTCYLMNEVSVKALLNACLCEQSNVLILFDTNTLKETTLKKNDVISLQVA